MSMPKNLHELGVNARQAVLSLKYHETHDGQWPRGKDWPKWQRDQGPEWVMKFISKMWWNHIQKPFDSSLPRECAETLLNWTWRQAALDLLGEVDNLTSSCLPADEY